MNQFSLTMKTAKTTLLPHIYMALEMANTELLLTTLLLLLKLQLIKFYKQ